MSNLLSGREVRKQLRISTATYYRWLREGRLRGTRVGRDWRFPPEAVERLLSSGSEEADRRSALEALSRGLLGIGANRREVDAMIRAAGTDDGRAMVNLVLAHARRSRASTVHVEPSPEGWTIRERIDGILSPAGETLPRGAGERLVRALKESSGREPDASAPRPASWRFFARVEDRTLDVQATSYPTAMGESVSLFVFDPATAVPPLDRLGFERAILKRTRELLSGRSGLFIVNGASGTGKTTTLYSLLLDLRRPGLKIMTAESPVEVRFEGIQQAQVDAGAGFGFREAAVAMVRSDVDVAMIAEMRDTETMQAAVEIGGNRRVLTVLHAKDALSALHRHMMVGATHQPLLADALLGILNQRLAGRSCPHCAVREPVREADARALGLQGRGAAGRAVYNRGCERCRRTGILGQAVVAELLVPDDALRRAVGSGADLEGLRAAVPAGFRTLREDLLRKVAEGVVSPPEAARVLR